MKYVEQTNELTTDECCQETRTDRFQAEFLSNQRVLEEAGDCHTA